MKVIKFGGSSVASAAQVRKVLDIVRADPQRRIVVVSAPGKRNRRDTKVTDLLINAARARLTGRGDAAQAAVDDVVARFRAIARGLRLKGDVISPIAEDLVARLGADSTDEDAYLDQMKAAGEDHCARLVAAAFRQAGQNAHYVNPRDAGMLLSDEPGNARVLTAAYGRLRSLRDVDGIVIFPGFFGFTESGRLVTFPRGGSDITGAILAAAVDADVYENFTDVDAILAADPGLVSNPRGLAEITYREMRELSYAGFSVFHDEALEPVIRARIPVNVRNTNNPAAPGTFLLPERDATDVPVTGIAAMAGFCSIYVSKYLMNRQVGFGRRLMGILEDEGVPFEHVPTGIDNMSVIVRESRFPQAAEARVLHRIRSELDADEVSLRKGLALVMLVGEGMRHVIGIAGRACSALANAGVNLEMINQGSSEVSMMFGIQTTDIERAVRALYDEFLLPKPRRRARKATAR